MEYFAIMVVVVRGDGAVLDHLAWMYGRGMIDGYATSPTGFIAFIISTSM